jgi:hypothetical protein
LPGILVVSEGGSELERWGYIRELKMEKFSRRDKEIAKSL